MLSALHDDTSVFAPKASPRRMRSLSKGQLRCPACGQPVHFKGREGGTVIWHFAHYSDADCTHDDPDYGPESQEHKLLKWGIYQWLVREFGPARVYVESRIEQTNQVADVLLITEGRRIAFEVQRSPISAEAWRERREKYQSASVQDVWVLVGNSHFDLIHHRSPDTVDSTHRPTAESHSERYDERHRNGDDGEAPSMPPGAHIITLDPGHLGRALFRADGRLLWISQDAVDHLKKHTSGLAPPNLSDVYVREIDGIGWVYRNADGAPWETVERLEDRPFADQPEYLVTRNT